MVEADGTSASSMQANVDVMFYTSHAGHERFGGIDLNSGEGVDVGPYTNPEVKILRPDWPALNGAIYEDEFYVILNKRLPSDSTADQAEARLARVDMTSGDVELLGSTIERNLVAMEIDHCGTIYAAGFTLSNQIGEFFGDTSLYRVDWESGELDLIGDTGLERIMDLAFDPDGHLWGTVGNVLYTFDLESAAVTEVAEITGIEDEHGAMGLAFTSEGELYATSPFSEEIFRIDPASGVATAVGSHGFTIPHGGDIPMMPRDTSCRKE